MEIHECSIQSSLRLLVNLKKILSEILVKTSETDGATGLPGAPVPPHATKSRLVRLGSKVTTPLTASQPSRPQFPDLQIRIRELKLKHHAQVLRDNTEVSRVFFPR